MKRRALRVVAALLWAASCAANLAFLANGKWSGAVAGAGLGMWTMMAIFRAGTDDSP